jgi:hypothetical protein
MKPRVLVATLVILAACLLGGVYWYLYPNLVKAPGSPAHSGTSLMQTPALRVPVPQEDWEVKLEKTVHSAYESEDIAARLISLFPSLPARGKQEAAQHLCDNVADETYAKMRSLTVDARLGVEVLEVFYTDLGNRDEKVRLPVLLEIAKTTRHPFRKEAAEELAFILDTEPGKDFSRMEAALNSYLKNEL